MHLSFWLYFPFVNLLYLWSHPVEACFLMKISYTALHNFTVRTSIIHRSILAKQSGRIGSYRFKNDDASLLAQRYKFHYLFPPFDQGLIYCVTPHGHGVWFWDIDNELCTQILAPVWIGRVKHMIAYLFVEGSCINVRSTVAWDLQSCLQQKIDYSTRLGHVLPSRSFCDGRKNGRTSFFSWIWRKEGGEKRRKIGRSGNMGIFKRKKFIIHISETYPQLSSKVQCSACYPELKSVLSLIKSVTNMSEASFLPVASVLNCMGCQWKMEMYTWNEEIRFSIENAIKVIWIDKKHLGILFLINFWVLFWELPLSLKFKHFCWEK